MALPRPILSLTIAPIDPDEREHLHAVLAEISGADPAISFAVGPTSGMTRLRGETLEQLLAVCRNIEHEKHIPIDFTRPEVICIETIRQPAEGEGKYIRQTGGRGNYGHVKLRLDPGASACGISFASTASAGIIPQEFLTPIEEGVREAARAGVLAGHEVVDLRATLYDGSYHEADSNPTAFRIAAAQAFQDAARRGRPVVMEPVMNVVFTVPEARAGATMAEISARRGRVAGVNNSHQVAIVQASIPLAEMLRDADPAPTTMLFEGFVPISSGRDDADPAGSAVRSPRGPKPLAGSSAAEPDFENGFDWT